MTSGARAVLHSGMSGIVLAVVAVATSVIGHLQAG